MKISNSQKFKLGLFVIITSILLILALYLIGKKQHLFGSTVRITAVFDNVNGLKNGNNVRYSGINVGTVTHIEMVNDTTICVNMILEQSILSHMKKNAKAAIGSDGLVGSMVVNIFPGQPGGVPLVEGDTLKSTRKVSTGDMLSTLSMTNDNAAELSKNLLRISRSLQEQKGTLGRLINDESMGEDLKMTMSYLNNASQEASLGIDKINRALSSFDEKESLLYVLVKDTMAGRQFKEVIGNLQRSSENIEIVIDHLNDVVLRVKEEKGMVNFLVSDTVFVNDVQETVRNIKQGSYMLNENLEAMRHNILFRGYFKKQEKEQSKY